MLDIAITGQGPAGRRVTLQGRLDTLTTPQLEGALAPLLGSPEVTSLVFQVDALEYISSAGVRCVIRAQRTLADRGGAGGDRRSAARRAHGCSRSSRRSRPS